ncbi:MULTISPECIES: cation diffusion facilitator family transporter [unclassified Vibrio]|uniref:cation diffusion facilitator family transporter n=1 Tax=unclassified Vibrio TaxID=2614977 RepID=UPI000243B9DB|nr:cation transporter [Vibrio sp. EJY3]AEX24955.1 cation diffusion facilitator family transporter [Vibrio sp. EJY3]MEE3877320.1 cation transporter [Vibrio sp. YYF0003]
MSSNSTNDKKLIQFSITMGCLYTTAGVVWGLLIQSGIILFDAIYSGVSILLSMMTMYALVMISKDNSFDSNQFHQSSFHMGRTAVEPLVNLVKSFVIISICLYGFVSAVLVLHNGGAENNESFSGIAYGLITALICLSSWGYLKYCSQEQNDLIQAECEQWLVDAIFSLLVVVSFVISHLMMTTDSLKHLASYVDPISVILATLYFIKVPITRLVKSIKELLVMAPDESVQQEIEDILRPLSSRYSFDDHVARITKTGRQLFVDITFIDTTPSRMFEIQELDKIRVDVESCLKPLSNHLWLTISFTHDRYWA